MTRSNSYRKILLSLLAFFILALGACAAPAPVEPTLAPPPTVTLEPTPPPTETPIPTATPDPYPLEMEKFNSFPQNTDYLVTHPEEFVRAPDPFRERDAFNTWWDEKLLPALGEKSEREIIGNFEKCTNFKGTFYCSGPFSEGNHLLRNPHFFYFVNEGEVYPVPIFTIPWGEMNTVITMMPVLRVENMSWSPDFDPLASITTDDYLGEVFINTTYESLDEFTRRFMEAGLVVFNPAFDVDELGIIFGPGHIGIFK